LSTFGSTNASFGRRHPIDEFDAEHRDLGAPSASNLSEVSDGLW
jgi:hypothetical protein